MHHYFLYAFKAFIKLFEETADQCLIPGKRYRKEHLLCDLADWCWVPFFNFGIHPFPDVLSLLPLLVFEKPNTFVDLYNFIHFIEVLMGLTCVIILQLDEIWLEFRNIWRFLSRWEPWLRVWNESLRHPRDGVVLNLNAYILKYSPSLLGRSEVRWIHIVIIEVTWVTSVQDLILLHGLISRLKAAWIILIIPFVLRVLLENIIDLILLLLVLWAIWGIFWFYLFVRLDYLLDVFRFVFRNWGWARNYIGALNFVLKGIWVLFGEPVNSVGDLTFLELLERLKILLLV